MSDLAGEAMTHALAMELAEAGAPVVVSRGGAAWHGTIVGIVDQPSLVLQTPQGRKVIALDGMRVLAGVLEGER